MWHTRLHAKSSSKTGKTSSTSIRRRRSIVRWRREAGRPQHKQKDRPKAVSKISIRPLAVPGAPLHVPRGASPPCRNKGPFGTKVPFTSWIGECSGPETQGGVMTTLQAMCLGAMLAWTPSLVVLAWFLREAPLDELQHDPS